MKKVKENNINKVKKESLLSKFSNWLRNKIKKIKVAKPRTTPQIMRTFFQDFNENNSIIQLDDNHFSVCFEYQDVSFAKANYEEQENIFLKWVQFLHSFNLNDHIQIVCFGTPVKTVDYPQIIHSLSGLPAPVMTSSQYHPHATLIPYPLTNF